MNVKPDVLPVIACPWADVRTHLKYGFKYEPCPGAEEAVCSGCGQKVHTGPKQREVLKQRADAVVVCFICAVRKFGVVKPEDVKSAGGTGGTYTKIPNG